MVTIVLNILFTDTLWMQCAHVRACAGAYSCCHFVQPFLLDLGVKIPTKTSYCDQQCSVSKINNFGNPWNAVGDTLRENVNKRMSHIDA